MKNILLFVVSAFFVCNTINAQIPVRINCTGSGNGEVQRTYHYDGDRCGATDYYSGGFVASYDFLPDQTSDLTHLYVNNIDRINDIYSHYSGTSGTAYTFLFTVNSASSITINPVFTRVSLVPISINCTGTGSGEVQRSFDYYGDLCGATEYVYGGFYYSYDFLPDQTSELTHLYVNNVDRINDIYTHYSGTSGTTHRFGFTLNSASSVTVNPVFNRIVYQIVAVSADSTMGYVTGSRGYEVGTRATLTAIPYEGYIFSHWHDAITANPRLVDVVSNASFMAYFAPSNGIVGMPSNNYTIQIYPNPAANIINVSIAGFNGDVQLNVFDIDGHKVANQNFNCNESGNAKIDANGLQSGIYFVQAIADNKVTVQKIVVKR